MNDEQALLRSSLIGRLASHNSETAWRELLDAGVCGICVPEALGGLGMTAADAAPVMEAVGEHCLPTPFLETCIVAARLLTFAQCPEGDEVLRAISSGARVAVAGLDSKLRGGLRAALNREWVINGTVRLVLDADDADFVLVVASNTVSPGLFLMPDGFNCSRRTFPTIDGRSAADLTFEQAPAILLTKDATFILGLVSDEALACLAVEAAALMRRLVRDTVSYSKQREQFGQAIARFQVVQHRLVDMHIQARRAGAISRRAMTELSGTESERKSAVSAAKATIGQAGRYVGQQAIQLHGGMGMSMELAVGRCFKRLTVIEGELGSTDDHLQRYAANLGA